MEEKKDENLMCDDCQLKFSSISNLRRHLKNIHAAVPATQDSAVSSIDLKSVCPECKAEYANNFNLKRHMEKKHQILSAQTRNDTIKCPMCESYERTLNNLDQHIFQEHKIEQDIEERSFATIDEFLAWKQQIEEEDLTYFTHRSSAKGTSYYTCHRAGSSQGEHSSKRQNWSKSVKIGSHCPARIVLTKNNDNYSAKLFKTHVGHELSIKFLHLNVKERNLLAGRIKEGVPFDRILDDVRESVNVNVGMKRLHLVEKKDLHNIMRDFELDRVKCHDNDAISVDLWVKEQQLLGDDNPVIAYKPQGLQDKLFPKLNKEDFFLVLMTKYQKSVLSPLINNKILIDSTHCITAYDFQLTTLLTVDDYGAGCCVAFCLSNRVDAPAMEEFFKSIKSEIGMIKTKVFMSDDAPSYSNAWCQIMGRPQHHLLCTWHVDKSWKYNLSKVKDAIKKVSIYKACRTLLEITDRDTFHDYLVSFLDMCYSDPDTKEYGEYFERHYAHRPEQWAFCYRCGLGLNTNMYLEALHKKLKYCYMEGKQNRRVDKCVSFVLKLARNMMFERIIRQMKNTPTHRMQEIGNSHSKSSQISDDMIEFISDNKWKVQSSHNSRIPYTVEINSSTECSGCPLSCPECNICVHQFTCSCIDHLIRGNFCKHVHACIRRKQITDSSIVNDESVCTNTFEEHKKAILSSVHKSQDIQALDSRAEVQSTLETVLGMATASPDEIMPDILQAARHFMSVIKKICSGNKKESTSRAPANKNIEKQRFHSTKQKRKTVECVLVKPSDAEKIEIESLFQGQDAVLIHKDFDHSYDQNATNLTSSTQLKRRKT